MALRISRRAEQPTAALCALSMPLTSMRDPFERVEARKPDLGASGECQTNKSGLAEPARSRWMHMEEARSRLNKGNVQQRAQWQWAGMPGPGRWRHLTCRDQDQDGITGKFGVLIGPGSVIPVDGRDCSLRLSAPSPNGRATSKQALSPRIEQDFFSGSECVRGAVSGDRQNCAECHAEQLSQWVHVSLRRPLTTPVSFYFIFFWPDAAMLRSTKVFGGDGGGWESFIFLVRACACAPASTIILISWNSFLGASFDSQIKKSAFSEQFLAISYYSMKLEPSEESDPCNLQYYSSTLVRAGPYTNRPRSLPSGSSLSHISPVPACPSPTPMYGSYTLPHSHVAPPSQLPP
eukprot:scaffold21250_cov111-Isochrysis_galbana.AAC.7